MKPGAIAIALCLATPPACTSGDPPAPVDAPTDPANAPSLGIIGQLEEAKAKTACTELQMLRYAVEMFTATKGECPPDLATLEHVRLVDRLRDDPWGHPYRLRCSELELRSAGPDGEPGTADDIVLGATGDECAPK